MVKITISFVRLVMKKVIRYIGIFAMITAIGASSEAPSIEEIRLDHCMVKAITDVEVAATMAGVIQSVSVEEGTDVTSGEEILRIDDTQAVINSDLAKMTWQQAKERSKDKSSLNYSRATASVAKSEYQRSLKTNENVPHAISEIQIEKLELEMKQAQIGVEKAIFDSNQANWEQEIRQKEWQIAQANKNQHYLKSPVSGTIVKKSKNTGEWVNQGETVFRIARMDTMIIQGYIDITRNDIQEVAGKPVLIDLTFARNQTVSFPGRIVRVNPMVQAGDKVLVEAEVRNKKENGQWLMIPGMSADMRIQLNESEPLNISKQWNSKVLY